MLSSGSIHIREETGRVARHSTTAKRLQMQMQRLKFVYGATLCLRGKSWLFFWGFGVSALLSCGCLSSLWAHPCLWVVCHWDTHMLPAEVITRVSPNVLHQWGFLSFDPSLPPHFWLLISISPLVPSLVQVVPFTLWSRRLSVPEGFATSAGRSRGNLTADSEP